MIAERPLAADEQGRQVVAGVVLQQRRALDDRAVGQHRLQPRDAGADGPVAHGAYPAGVGGGEAADGRAVARGEVDARVQARRACALLQPRERDAGAGPHLRGGAIDLSELGEPRRAEDHLAAAWHAGADHAGVAALGDDGRAVLAAGGDHRRHLPGVGGAHDRARGAAIAAGPVDLEGRADVLLDEDVALPDRGRQALEQIVGHM